MGKRIKITIEADSAAELEEVMREYNDRLPESQSEALEDVPGRTYEEQVVYLALKNNPGSTLQRIHEAAEAIDSEVYNESGGEFNDERHRVRRMIQNLQGEGLADNDYKKWFAVDPDTGKRIT